MILSLNVSKKFSTHNIIFPDIKAQSSDFIQITGASGSGKTTFCEILAKFKTLDTGEIFINNKNINSINVFEHIHYISQFPEHNLLGATCFEELELWINAARPSSLHPDIPRKPNVKDAKNVIYSILNDFSLGNLINMPIWRLSFGQKKALAFCALIIVLRSVWVLDEPLAGLDIDLSEKLNDMIIEFIKKGGIVIVTSHEKNLDFEFTHSNTRIINIELDEPKYTFTHMEREKGWHLEK